MDGACRHWAVLGAVSITLHWPLQEQFLADLIVAWLNRLSCWLACMLVCFLLMCLC
jgi:hypothetical protein